MHKRIIPLLLLAGLIRFIALDSNPAGIFHDEAEKGYSAYSLLRIGGTLGFTDTDILMGRTDIPTFHPWPLFVDVWGSLTSMIYQYASVPFLALFGLNAWSLRLPAATIGFMTVLMVVPLAHRLTGNRGAALWAVFFLAVSPWHVVFSRWAQQGIFVPFLLSAGILAYLKGQDSANAAASNGETRWYMPGFSEILLCLVGSICFGLAFYAYSGSQPFLLAFLACLAWLWRKSIRKQPIVFLLAVLFFITLIIPALTATFGNGAAGAGRLQRLSVFSMEAPWAHKSLLILKNYLAHFSPQFLFLTGDALDRHSLRGFGMMLHLEIFTLVAGLIVALRRHSQEDKLLLAWFLTFPLSAAITNEGIPHALRTLHAVPCPQILSAIGATHLMQWLGDRSLSRIQVAIKAAFLLNTIIFLAALFLYYPHYSAPSFEYGIREAIAMTKTEGKTNSSNSHIFIPPESGMPLIPELFYFHARVPPELLLEKGMRAARIQIIRQPAPNASLLPEMMKPNDFLLLSPQQALLIHSNQIRFSTVYWRPYAFKKAFEPAMVVLQKLPSEL